MNPAAIWEPDSATTAWISLINSKLIRASNPCDHHSVAIFDPFMDVDEMSTPREELPTKAQSHTDVLRRRDMCGAGSHVCPRRDRH